MFDVFQGMPGNLMSDWASRFLMDAALAYFMTFILVLVRLSGLMLIGPYFGHSAIPTRVRILLAFSLALVVTPALPDLQERGFEKLDVNQDKVLSGAEVPRGIREAYMRSTAKDPEAIALTLRDFQRLAGVPSTLFDLCWVAGTELLIGMLLGFGALVILSGLQLAGENFDKQAGTAMSEIFNPALETSASPTGHLLFLLGTIALLVMLPFDGHLMMLMSLLKTFEVLPVGLVWVDISTLDLMRHLISQSLVIAVQISAPLLAAMALLSVAMGFLGYTVPQINVLVLGFPIRAMLSLVILLVTFSGATGVIVELFPQVLEEVTNSLLSGGESP
ncbi:MAG: flagellar biosynthetic protein FliR [Planctomycetaceae bacterium]|nr:flagellar biosynthetic protein FliR [Planctomycetaceae bacterium]